MAQWALAIRRKGQPSHLRTAAIQQTRTRSGKMDYRTTSYFHSKIHRCSQRAQLLWSLSGKRNPYSRVFC
ncbi:hypothetical protein ATCV1_z373R [Acanthocystis turfacea chlorella virus 1]|uniref:Uncharacterized protein z373R n=1 Tax=Chlorovirus heliozoae TaxID=322019 RepID=A7K8Y3_9PHYC|nr:hypothetical protein ATCV1_z373R [Acanthocystis turfacea chlorella virus 1]ABT16507.1 hypothetical protein ATCV1_z373R [Acanthocystis turfacea chlorella virus 1]